MFKLILKLIAIVLGLILIAFTVLWIICEIAPILLGAVVFIPWLVAALAGGAKVK